MIDTYIIIPEGKMVQLILSSGKSHEEQQTTSHDHTVMHKETIRRTFILSALPTTIVSYIYS